MRIESSSLSLQSENSAYSRYEKSEQLMIGQLQTDKSGNQNVVGLGLSRKVTEERSFLASYEELMQQDSSSPLKEASEKIENELNQGAGTPSFTEINDNERLNILLLLRLLNNFREKDQDLLKALGLDDLDKAAQNPLSATLAGSSQGARPPRMAMQYSMQESLYQSETTQFSAKGQVKTADGKTIDINMELHMSRETLETKDLNLRVAAATKDPLVVNFDGSSAELSEERFSFDLTADGQKEWIATLASNSAFLAMDKNKDGVINDGSELFGAKTGDGFGELAQYDDDKNGWIDENDSAFKDLMLWIKAGSEDQQLVGLKDAGVGALYTGKAATEFHMQDGNQNTLGVLRSTGVFLKEDGGAGTLQQVDLAV